LFFFFCFSTTHRTIRSGLRADRTFPTLTSHGHGFPVPFPLSELPPVPKVSPPFLLKKTFFHLSMAFFPSPFLLTLKLFLPLSNDFKGSPDRRWGTLSFFWAKFFTATLFVGGALSFTFLMLSQAFFCRPDFQKVGLFFFSEYCEMVSCVPLRSAGEGAAPSLGAMLSSHWSLEPNLFHVLYGFLHVPFSWAKSFPLGCWLPFVHLPSFLFRPGDQIAIRRDGSVTFLNNGTAIASLSAPS